MAEDGDELSKKQVFVQKQETFKGAPETQANRRFPARATGVVEVPLGSRGPRSLYISRHGDSFGFTLRHFIIYPPESLSESDGRHAAVGALLAPMDTIFVKNVAELGPAERAGLQRGDRILYVNGEPVSNLTYGQVVQKIQSSPKYLHLLVVPKEEDVLQKYFADTAHNPLSNQTQFEDKRKILTGHRGTPRGFHVDATSWRTLHQPQYHPSDYGRLVPKISIPVQQQKSADDIYSSLKEFVSSHQQKSAENIYSSPRDSVRPNERKILEIYTEPVLNDSTQRPRAQPQVPLCRKMGRRASEGSGSGISEKEYLSPELTMNRNPYSVDTYSNSLEMPGINYPNIAGCRLSLDAGKRRESSSSLTSSLTDGSKDSLTSFESTSTLTGQETDDSVVMTRLRKSLQEKEEFLRRPSNPPEHMLIQREFYGRPKRLDKPVWPPTEVPESPGRINKPTHQNFQRVKNDIEIEREISQNYENQSKGTKNGKDRQYSSNLCNIQEGSVGAEGAQTNGNSLDAEDRRNYSPSIQTVQKRARQFETGRLMPEDNPIANDRTSFYRSELARLSAKRAVPNVAVRTREYETLSNEPRRDPSSSSTSSAATLRRSYRDSRSLDSSGSTCSISSNAAENNKQLPGNFSIPIGSTLIHCPPPSDYKPTKDVGSDDNQNKMRMRSNSTGSWVAAVHSENSVNDYAKSNGTTTTGPQNLDVYPEPGIISRCTSPLIPLSVAKLQVTPSVSVTPPEHSLSKQQPAAVRPTQLDLGAPKRPSRHIRPTSPMPDPIIVQEVCDDKPLVVRRIKNTNLSEEDRIMRRESYLKATDGGRLHFEGGDISDGDLSPRALRSAHRRWRPPLFPGDIQQLRKLFEDTASSLGESVSGGSSSSISLERDKSSGSPCEKEKPQFMREGPLHCKITEIDGKRSADRSWKQVWAVLHGPKLFLYKDRHHQSPVGTSEAAEQSLASGVDMRGSCVQVAEDYTKRKHVLRVSSVLPCRSELLLQADNTVELAEWVQALQEQVASSTEVEAKLEQYSNNNKQQAVPQAVAATTSIQVPHQKSKLPNLRNRSPTGQSPVSKTRKPSQVNDPSTSPKSKTWRGRVAKQFRRIHQGASSPSSPTAPEGSTFGNHLEDCLPSSYNPFVPKLVEICTDIVETRGLEMTGIYRVPGNNAAVTALTEEVNKNYDEIILTDQRWNDVHVVSSLLKSFFRKMPDSLLTRTAYHLFIEADKIENPHARLKEIRRLIKSLPPYHYNTLKHLILHLKRVVDHSELNKMEARNLAIVFGPTIVRAGEENVEKMVSDMTHQCKIVETLLVNGEWFFTEEDIENLNLPAIVASNEIFSNEAEVNTALLRDNISKVEGLSPFGHSREQKVKKEIIHSLLSAAQKRYKKKGTKNILSSNEIKDLSPIDHKDFIKSQPINININNSTNDLKISSIENKPNDVASIKSEPENSLKNGNKDLVFNYKTGSEELKRRVQHFIEETQSNLQRPRKPECNSNNSLDLKLPNSYSSSVNNVRHSLNVNTSDRIITKTSSASNVFTRTSNSETNRNSTGAAIHCNHPNYSYFNKGDKNNVNKLKDSFSDVSTTSDYKYKPTGSSSFAMRRGSSAENIAASLDNNSNGHLKKIKYGNDIDNVHKSGSLDSLNKIQSNLDEEGDLVATITKIYDEKKKELNPSILSIENIPYADESPEKHSRQGHSNKENIPSSPKTYRNPSLHKTQYSTSKLTYTNNTILKEKHHEVPEKDVDCTLNSPDNERHINNFEKINKINLLNVNSGNTKLKRSESLNKPDRTGSPLNNKLKRSESLNKASDRLKRSDSLTKNEKTECNINKKREVSSSTRRSTKDFIKLKRKNGMPERSIKRRHTVGGTKDPDKITLLDNRQEEMNDDISENNKEKNLRTSSPDLSSTRRERLFFEVNLIGPDNMVVSLRQHLIGARPQSFPESTVYNVPLESHV